MDQKQTGAFHWNYDRSELIADGVIHALGVSLGLIGAITIIVIASQATKFVTIVSILIYVVGLLAMLGFSAAYNMWPISPTKWILRRFDHSAIYLLIAGTYTPFIAQLKITLTSGGLLVGVWTTAAVGVVLKLVLPGRFDRMAVVLYVVLSWSGAMFGAPLIASFQTSTLWLLVAGGVLYSMGLLVHLWPGLRFRTAIWHAFVLLAASCHFAAVLNHTMLAPA
jgi:hemolysin III